MTKRIETPVGWYLDDLSDFEFQLQVMAPPITLKNSKTAFLAFITRAKGKTRFFCPGCRLPLTGSANITNSKPADAYLKEATRQITGQWKPVFRSPIPKRIEVNAAIVSYLKTQRDTDADNLYAAVHDAMEAAEVLVDDCQIRTHDDSDRRIDRKFPRVEITLTPCKRSAMSVCEWNPEAGAVKKTPDEPCRNDATVAVGSNGKHRLCDDCAGLAVFDRYRSRTPLANVPTPKPAADDA